MTVVAALLLSSVPQTRAADPETGWDAAQPRWSLADHLARTGSPRLLLRLSPGAGTVEGAGVVLSSTLSSELESALAGLGAWRVEPALTVTPADRPLAAGLGLSRDVAIVMPTRAAAAAGLAAIAEVAGIESATLEPVGELLDEAISLDSRAPIDPLIPQQWPLSNSGQSVGGVAGLPGACANVRTAWLLAPSQLWTVRVAVIDSGVASTHPDLVAVMAPGWNVVLNTAQTGDEVSSHGTHLAGIIAGAHNDWGIAGISPSARIMPVKATNNYGTTGVSWVASGIVWAADNGARVLNISIGFTSDSQTLRSAVQYAAAKGCLIVCSAGNVPTSPIVYPGRYPEVIAVGATNNRDGLWASSATGPELDLTAPGVDVLSTWHVAVAPGTHKLQTGTSQAAPQVAGVAALVWSIAPNLTSSQVRMILESSVKDLGEPGWDPQFGHGRIDAAKAVAIAMASVSPTTPAQGSCRVDMNHDGVVSSADFFLYIELFAVRHPRADFVAPYGVISGEDFFQFALEYSVGCQL